MLPRFLAAIDPSSGTARLTADEAHHLSQVLRLGAGDEVAVFDGEGREFRARVEQVTRDGASLRLIEARVEGHPASALQGDRPATATILIGPEGGWSAEEVEAAVAAGYVPITLGRRTLRADAMPIVALGVLQYLWSDL